MKTPRIDEHLPGIIAWPINVILFPFSFFSAGLIVALLAASAALAAMPPSGGCTTPCAASAATLRSWRNPPRKRAALFRICSPAQPSPARTAPAKGPRLQAPGSVSVDGYKRPGPGGQAIANADIALN